MLNKIKLMLGMKSMSTRHDSQNTFSFENIENFLQVKLDSEHKKLLSEFSTAIVFTNGAKYKPNVNSPVDDSNGYQSIEMIYGLNGEHNLLDMNQIYSDQLPKDLFCIGESFGGNLICASKKSGGLFFWCHETNFEEPSTFYICNSFERFLAMLETDDGDDDDGNNNLIDSESFLDF